MRHAQPNLSNQPEGESGWGSIQRTQRLGGWCNQNGRVCSCQFPAKGRNTRILARSYCTDNTTTEIHELPSKAVDRSVSLHSPYYVE